MTSMWWTGKVVGKTLKVWGALNVRVRTTHDRWAMQMLEPGRDKDSREGWEARGGQAQSCLPLCLLGAHASPSLLLETHLFPPISH